MTARMLALDVRRGPALVLGIALLGLGAALLLSGSTQCDGRWAGAVLALRNEAWLLVPCVLAAGVWRGGSPRRRHVDETIGASAAPRWRRAAIEGGSLALAGSAVFVVLLALLTVSGGCTAAVVDDRSLAAALAGVVSVPAAAFAGLAIGRLATTPMAAPLTLFAALAVTAVVGAGWSSDSGGALLVLPALGEDLGIGQLATTTSVAQLIWFVGLAVSGWLLASRSPARLPILGLAPAAAGLAAVAALAPG